MNLEEFFDSLDLQTVQDFVKDGREEDVNLDFKVVSNASFKSTDDKRNFAKALSGFANSSGGIVIWGIDARKNSDGVDVASEEKPIENLSLLISKLNSFTGEFVTPIVDGVQHKKIEIKNDAGFAVTLVPACQFGPHMAKAGEHRYYKRSGDSFYRMEHFDLEDMFGRRPKPSLEFICKEGTHFLSRNELEVRHGKLRFVVGLRNNGRAIAKFPYLSINVNYPHEVAKFGLDGNGKSGLPQIAEHDYGGLRRSAKYGDSSLAVYPQVDLEVTTIEFNIENMISKNESRASIASLDIAYVLACEGSTAETGQHCVSEQEIYEILFNNS